MTSGGFVYYRGLFCLVDTDISDRYDHQFIGYLRDVVMDGEEYIIEVTLDE